MHVAPPEDDSIETIIAQKDKELADKNDALAASRQLAACGAPLRWKPSLPVSR